MMNFAKVNILAQFVNKLNLVRAVRSLMIAQRDKANAMQSSLATSASAKIAKKPVGMTSWNIIEPMIK
jgi:hypothetical protein